MSVPPCVRGRVEMRAVTKGDFSGSMNATFSPVSEGRQWSGVRRVVGCEQPFVGGLTTYDSGALRPMRRRIKG